MALCDMPIKIATIAVTLLALSCGNYDDADSDPNSWTEPIVGRGCYRHERRLTNYDEHHVPLVCTPILTTQYWLPRSP